MDVGSFVFGYARRGRIRRVAAAVKPNRVRQPRMSWRIDLKTLRRWPVTRVAAEAQTGGSVIREPSVERAASGGGGEMRGKKGRPVDRSKQAVVAVERRDAIGFGHGRIVESRLDEVLQRIQAAWLAHDRLADVDNFGSVGPETMDA